MMQRLNEPFVFGGLRVDGFSVVKVVGQSGVDIGQREVGKMRQYLIGRVTRLRTDSNIPNADQR